MTNETGISVSELNLMVAEAIRRDPRTRSVLVRGEVSGFKNHLATEHWYFSLKDEHASIPCAMFRGSNLRAQIRPKDGDQVLAEGYIDFYGPQGKIQLIVNTPAGKTAAHDDSYLRKGAIKHRVTYITTMVAAKAAAEGINQMNKHGNSEVLSLQEWHALIH